MDQPENQGPIPWEELKELPEADQEAWWRRTLTPTAAALVDSARRRSSDGRSFQETVLILALRNLDLVPQLLRERETRLNEKRQQHPPS